MKVLLIKPRQRPIIKEIDGSLESMQTLVGGTIQAIYPFRDTVALICNDDGKLLGLPPNRMLFDPDSGELCDVIAGDFFLCSAPPDSENFESLTDEQIKRYTQRFQRIEFFLGGAPW